MYTAVAQYWDPDARNCEVLVVRDDGHEVWGEDAVPAASVEDMPAAAERRLSGAVAYRVVGEWMRDEVPLVGPRWRAPAAVVHN